MNKTVRLYQEDVYLKCCDSIILDVITDRDDIIELGGIDEKVSACLVLNKTVFFPEGGGQPSDLGSLVCDFGRLELLYVFEKDEVVYHQLKIDQEQTGIPSPKSFPKPLSAIKGLTVRCELDWDRRFLHMQRHCGEHVLSAVFYELYGGVNRGFHMGDNYMTIDISLEESPEFTLITDEMMATAEKEANRMLWENLPVTTRYFASKEETEGLPMRKSLTLEKDIVLVCVGDESKAAGCVACCGTHPKFTGEVGFIKLYRWENYKGMTRITFDAGMNALENCMQEATLIKDLCKYYSADASTLMEKIRLQAQKYSETRQELYEWKQAHLSAKAMDIDQTVQEAGTVLIEKFDLLRTDDLLGLSKLLSPLSSKLILLVSLKENTLIMLSDGTPDCNKLVKDNAAVWRGKGGGRANSARVMFPTSDDLNCFLDYIHKAY